MCRCGTVTHYDGDGNLRALFPVRKEDKHRSSVKTGAVHCSLLEVADLVAEAKYDWILFKIEKRRSLRDEQRISDGKKKKEEERVRRLEQEMGRKRPQGNRGKETTNTIQEKDADDDIPFFMRKFTDTYPFGNVHMALRVGPLMLENGVEQ